MLTDKLDQMNQLFKDKARELESTKQFLSIKEDEVR